MRYIRFAVLSVTFLLPANWALAQEDTVGLFVNEIEAYDGYTLLAPLFHNSTYLIDNNGEVVHSWTHELKPAGATYLRPNGNLLRGSLTVNPAVNFGGLGGTMQELDWDGNILWEFVYSDNSHALHHDTALLPNGNLLMVAWEFHTVEEAIAMGRNPDLLAGGALWAEQIIEVRPTPPEGGEIVWEWHIWDHLVQDFDTFKPNFGVIRDHPELVNVNYSEAANADWLHFNAINYNAELDQIMVSSPGFSELWIIDHSTTTEEAAGHTGGNSGKGGDLMYRWGNRRAYQADPEDGQNFFRLQFNHDTHWIEPGLPGETNIMVFENGHNRVASKVHELIPPWEESAGEYLRDPDGAYSPAIPVWNYEQPGSFYSVIASGQQRMPNGNTLIVETDTGRIFEVTAAGEIVWLYINPVTTSGPLARNSIIPLSNPTRPIQENAIFRAYRYAKDYPAFAGKDLIPSGPLEGVATAIDDPDNLPEQLTLLQNYPNPFVEATTISFTLVEPTFTRMRIYDLLGREIRTLHDGFLPSGPHALKLEADHLPLGILFYRLDTGNTTRTGKMIHIR